jgi:hypothetical protein
MIYFSLSPIYPSVHLFASLVWYNGILYKLWTTRNDLARPETPLFIFNGVSSSNTAIEQLALCSLHNTKQ